MNQVVSYDLATGDVVWFTARPDDEPDSDAGGTDGMVFLMAGFRGNSLKAIHLNQAKGDITGTPAIAWTLDRDTPYVPSPVLYDNMLYVLKSNNGLLSAFDAKSGTPHYQVAAPRRPCRMSSRHRSAPPDASTFRVAKARRSC